MSNNKKIGKIKKVNLRELWEKEDKDFTKWMEDNIDYLNDVLDFDISIEESEKNAGPFKVDLFGEDKDGNKIIIENQLEKTDHSHLGQIMTYLVNLEAKTAIWIASKPVKEHAKVIDWLNQITPIDIPFYLIQVEAIRIESENIFAPLFTIISKPSEEERKIGEEKKEYAQRHILRKKFWTSLLGKAKDKTKLHSNVSPSTNNEIRTGSGKAGIRYNYSINENRGVVQVYLDKGKDSIDSNINKERFDKLYKNKEAIENELGINLSWERLDEKRASRIAFYVEKSGLKEEEKWDELQEEMIDKMIKLEKVFSKYIKKI